MSAKAVCPNHDQFQRLLDGTLGEADQATLTRHLDDCGSCQTSLQRLAAAGPALEAAARRLSADEFDDGTIMRDLVARFRDREKDDIVTSDHELSLDFLTPSDRPDLLGTFADYQVVKVVGQGGMGVVLKAFDPALNRFVAIKVLAPQLAAVAAARRRFAREARAAAAVSHDHVVPIYAVDEFKGLPYLVMPLIAGESLQDRLDRTGPLDVSQILRIGMQTASGLAAAHAQGLIHRDIKPSNILLENGVERVKITDFGLARTVDDASLTQSGVLAGTPQYMAPEQAHGETPDPRADLFSLGGVMYAMCLGRPPFRAASALAVLKRVCEDTPRPIREVNPDVPDWLAEIVMKLLAKNPADRFPSAAVVVSLLEQRLAELQSPASRPLSTLEPKPAIARPRNHWVAAAFLLQGAVAVLGWTEATAITNVSDLVATILRIKTPEGILIVQLDDPAVKVSVDADGKELTITGAGVHEVKLRPGSHQLRVTRDGKPVREELITISRGGKQVAKIEREGDGAAQAIASTDFNTARGRLDAAAKSSRGMQATRKRADDRSDEFIRAKEKAANQVPRFSELGLPEWQRAIHRSNAPRPFASLDPATKMKTTAVAYSPDGKTLAIASIAVLQLWDVQERKLVASLNDPAPNQSWANTIVSLAFSPGGKSLAAGSWSGTVTVWDVEKREKRFQKHHKLPEDEQWPDYGVWKVAFEPHGAYLASAGWDNTVRIWSSPTGLEHPQLNHAGKVRTLAFSPDGQTLATGMGFEPGNNVKLWVVSGHRERFTLPGNANGTVCMAFSPDGKLLATGGQDNLVRIWDIASRSELARLEGHSQLVEAVEFSPDGKWLVSVSGNYRLPEKSGEVRVWDIAGTATRPRWAFEPQTGPISGLAFAPDGKSFATSGGDGAVHIWGLDPAYEVKYKGPEQLWPIDIIPPPTDPHEPSGVMSLAVAPDGSLLAAGTHRRVKLYQLPSGKDRGDLRGHDSWVMKLAFSRDGKRLASSAADGTNVVWDISVAGKELGVLERPYVTTWPITFTPDGNSLLVTWRDNSIYSWDFVTGKRKLFSDEYRPGGLEFSPDGASLAVFGEGDPGGMIRLLKGNKVVQGFSGSGQKDVGLAEVSCVRFAPDGKTLFAGQQNRFKVPAVGAVESLYGPDDMIAESCEIATWDIASGKATRFHPSMKGPIRDIAVSPDGKKLLLVGGRPGIDEGDAFLWRAGDREVFAALAGHHGAVRAAVFMDQGRQVVTACDDGSLRFWRVPAPMSPDSL